MSTWIVPLALEEAAWEAARVEVGEAKVTEAALARSVVDRSLRYTSERDRLATPSDPVGDLAARATFFTVADAIKIAIPLRELLAAGALPTGRPLRIVDLGAGCGAMTLGALAVLDVPLAVTAIDHDVRALRIAAAACKAFAASRDVPLVIHTRPGDVATAPLPACDLVLLGSVLNELPGDAPLGVVQRALAAVGPDGAVIVVEPALRETSRALHGIRDAMIAAGAHVFAPCTRTSAPCPMLADERDWCHEDRPVQLPTRTGTLARRTHLRDAGLRFSYLVLRHAAEPRLASGAAWRVVSAPMPDKGKLELFGCGEPGRVTLRLLKRNRADGNRGVERARRGDALTIAAPVVDDRVEVGRDTAVERTDPSAPAKP